MATIYLLTHAFHDWEGTFTAPLGWFKTERDANDAAERLNDARVELRNWLIERDAADPEPNILAKDNSAWHEWCKRRMDQIIDRVATLEDPELKHRRMLNESDLARISYDVEPLEQWGVL